MELKELNSVRFLDNMKCIRKNSVITPEAREKVIMFFNEVSPYKKETITINKVKAVKMYLEMTLTQCYKGFKEINPEIVICQTSFEKLRPKNVKLKQQSKHQVCCHATCQCGICSTNI